MELMGRNAFLGRCHEVRRQKPLVQRDMRALEHRTRADREFASTAVALEHSGLGLTSHLTDVVRAAERAGNAIGPTVLLHVGNRSGFVRKDGLSEV
jgi:hypothetical protein